MIRKLMAATALIVSTMWPAIALSQTEGDVPVGTGLDIVFTLILLGGGLVVSGLSWLGKKLNDFLNAKIENEWVSGASRRLVSSVVDAVAMVNQTAKKELQAAKDPKSSGGTKITEQEAKDLGEEAWKALRAEYGGWDGLFALVKKIGIGDEAAARAKIDTMIKASVYKQKIESGRSGPQ